MKKRFILLVDGGTKVQSNSFVAAIKARKLGWWHWIGNAWLFTNLAGDISAAELRDLAKKHFPNSNNMVLELMADGSDTWSGFGPSSSERNMFRWIQENWKK